MNSEAIVDKVDGFREGLPPSVGYYGHQETKDLGDEPVDDTSKIDLAEALLFSAPDSDDTNKVTEAINLGVRVDETDSIEMTALHWASHKGNLAVVEKLLLHGANPNVMTGDKTMILRYSTPLSLAVRRCDLEIVKTLLEHGANPNEKVCEALDDHTALTLAARNNSTLIVRCLLSYGARQIPAELYHEKILTPLDYARAHNNQEMIELLTSRFLK